MPSRNDSAFEGLGECWVCTTQCGEDDFCDGCECFICGACCEISAEDLERNHDPDEHQREEVDF